MGTITFFPSVDISNLPHRAQSILQGLMRERMEGSAVSLRYYERKIYDARLSYADYTKAIQALHKMIGVQVG